MAWPQGKSKPKTGGRRKGIPNKRTKEFLEVLAEQNFCPARALVRTYRKAMKQYMVFDQVVDRMTEALEGEDPVEITRTIRAAQTLGYSAPTYLSIAENAAKELMNYTYPKRKAIEFKNPGDGGGSGGVIVFIPSNGREAKKAS